MAEEPEGALKLKVGLPGQADLMGSLGTYGGILWQSMWYSMVSGGICWYLVIQYGIFMVYYGIL